ICHRGPGAYTEADDGRGRAPGGARGHADRRCDHLVSLGVDEPSESDAWGTALFTPIGPRYHRQQITPEDRSMSVSQRLKRAEQQAATKFPAPPAPGQEPPDCSCVLIELP